MSAKLIVHNIPPSMAIDEFTSHFKVFKGFNNANFLYSDENGMLTAQIDFLNFEFADHAKKVMQNYQFPNHQHHQGLIIEFFKQENFKSDNVYDNYMPTNANQQDISNLNYNPNNNSNMNYYNPTEADLDGSKILYPFFKKMTRFSYDNQGQDFSNSQNQNQNQNPNYNNNMMKPNIISQQQQQQPNYIMNPNNPINNNAQNNVKLNPNFIVNEYPANPTHPNVNNLMGPIIQGNLTYPNNMEINPSSAIKNNILSNNANFIAPNYPNPNASNNNNTNSIALFKIPSSATNSLYVDGIPFDSNEREVAHIFRPFPGFQSVRLIPKKTKSGREFFLCFVDFENSLQSTIALNTLQEYRFSKKDKKGLKISYASEPREKKKNK